MAEERLADLLDDLTWIWSDDSVDSGVRNRGGRAVIMLPDGSTREVRAATGSLHSSTRAEAELFYLRAAREDLASIEECDTS